MLCSISSGKSGSKWLDRLRSSKGFPAGDDLDLEQFLNHPQPNNSDRSGSNLSMHTTNTVATKSDSRILDRNQTADIPNRNGDAELFGIVSNVLSELFNMGDSNDSSRIDGRKRCRKQLNPRICAVSTSVNVDERCSIDEARRDELASGENICLERKQKSDRLKKQEKVAVGSVDVEEEDRSHGDLSRFSRMEVTVIDTSCESWKFEKLLFRRRNVWKVRDKKCKWMNIGKKKRKGSTLDENFDGERPPKPSFGQCSLPSNEVHTKSERAEGAHKQTLKTLNRVSKKGLLEKSKKHGSSSSSVVLIKSIPTGKSKNPGANNPPPKCLNTKQKKQRV